MPRFRFSLLWLFGFVTLVAICLAAYRYLPEEWILRLPNLAVVALLVASSFALVRQGRKRAFWAGFAIWGWAYVVVNLSAAENTRQLWEDQWMRRLGTHDVLKFVYEKTCAPPPTSAGGMGGGMVGYGMGPMIMHGKPSPQVFFALAHTATMLLLAVFGGGLTSWLYRPSSDARGVLMER